MDGTHRKSFGRMADMLRSLADKAEYAGARCLPVRLFVLWTLRYAEWAARSYAFQMGLPGIYPELHSGNSREDAYRLADSLRILAAAFDRVTHLAARPPCPTSRHQSHALTRITHLFCVRPPLIDSS